MLCASSRHALSLCINAAWQDCSASASRTENCEAKLSSASRTPCVKNALHLQRGPVWPVEIAQCISVVEANPSFPRIFEHGLWSLLFVYGTEATAMPSEHLMLSSPGGVARMVRIVVMPCPQLTCCRCPSRARCMPRHGENCPFNRSSQPALLFVTLCLC